jgi:hypothetical protein
MRQWRRKSAFNNCNGLFSKIVGGPHEARGPRGWGAILDHGWNQQIVRLKVKIWSKYFCVLVGTWSIDAYVDFIILYLYSSRYHRLTVNQIIVFQWDELSANLQLRSVHLRSKPWILCPGFKALVSLSQGWNENESAPWENFFLLKFNWN